MKIKTLKKVSFIVLIWGFSCVGFAQQEAMFTQYMFNRLSFNPGYAGTSGSICLTGMYRDQWMGLKLDPSVSGGDAGSTPQNFLFSFDMPVRFLHGGLGATVFTDKVGYTSSTNINIDYAYHLFWGPGNLSIGVEGSFYSRTLNYKNLVGTDDLPSDPSTSAPSASEDPLLVSRDSQNEMLTDVSLGFYYQVPGVMYAGLSMKNLLAAKSTILNFQNSRYVYLTGGYEYVIPTDPSFRILPSALIRTADFSTFQIDLSCLVEYERSVWGGISYRFQDAIAILAGVNWKKLKIGLSYDFTTSGLGGISKPGRSKGSLEIYLRYCFKVIIPPKAPSSYQNTRYLL